jgi:uncharacterized protein YaiE (UPF0345 family)
MNIPTQFSNITALTKANVYFDGKVISHTIVFADQSKKTLGLIYPGTYHFNTVAAERMELVAGDCNVVLDGTTTPQAFKAGSFFDVPANSGFSITVTSGLCEYICSFLS